MIVVLSLFLIILFPFLPQEMFILPRLLGKMKLSLLVMDLERNGEKLYHNFSGANNSETTRTLRSCYFLRKNGPPSGVREFNYSRHEALVVLFLDEQYLRKKKKRNSEKLLLSYKSRPPLVWCMIEFGVCFYMVFPFLYKNIFSVRLFAAVCSENFS